MIATRFARNIVKLSTKPSFATQLANLEVRVTPYGLEKFPLTSLANLEPNKEGWEITPFDGSVSKSLRRSLENDIDRLGMKIYFDTKSETLKIVPKKDKTIKKFKKTPNMEPYVDSEGFVVEDIDDDSLFNKKHHKVSKAFNMVDNSHMRKRNKNKASNLNVKMKQFQDLANELDVSTQISERLGRIAIKNKKAMRQLLKRITSQETDEVSLTDEVLFSK